MALMLSEQYHKINLLAIDPGLNNTGIAIFEIDYHSKKILKIEAFTIATEKLKNNTGLADEDFAERLIKLLKLKVSILNVLANVNPCIVAIEAPFYNRFRPNAYGALVEVLCVIQSAILEFNYSILFKKVEPLLVKKCVGAGTMKGKLDVKECVKKIDLVMNVLVNDIECLDEHSIDAIAIGYSFLKLSGE